MTRQDVYNLIDGERTYQDKTWPDSAAPPLSPTGTLRLIDCIQAEANTTWHRSPDSVVDGQRVNDCDLIALRKIAAVAIRCMEVFGAPPRT